jgi:expansin (peptidoglycan-binding protein)
MWRFQGSNNYYIKIQARRINIPVTSIQFLDSGIWKSLSRTTDNFFISAGNITFPMVFPIQVRAISFDNQVITNSIQSLVNDVDIVGSNQFNYSLNSNQGSNTQNNTNNNSTNPSKSTTRMNSSFKNYFNFFQILIIFLFY